MRQNEAKALLANLLEYKERLENLLETTNSQINLILNGKANLNEENLKIKAEMQEQIKGRKIIAERNRERTSEKLSEET